MTFQKGNKAASLVQRQKSLQVMIGAPHERRDVVQSARKFTKTAIRVLVEVMKDKKANASARVGAAKAILDRGWGSTEKLTDLLNNLSDTQLTEAARAILQQWQANGGAFGTTVNSDKTVIISGTKLQEPEPAGIGPAVDVPALTDGGEDDDE